MALPILSRIFFVLWGLVALKKPDLVWKMEFCKIDEPSESYLPPCRSSSFAKAASQISNLALRSRVCGSGTNSQLKNQHISVIFQPYLCRKERKRQKVIGKNENDILFSTKRNKSHQEMTYVSMWITLWKLGISLPI